MRSHREWRALLSRAATLIVFLSAASTPTAQQIDPDALYRERATIARAEEAAAIWESRLARNPADFESAWKLARATYWLGQHGEPAARRRWLERGVAAGRTAASLEPKRPEGHFWMAANMGALAESFGLRQGLRYRGAIKDALETVLRLDPAFMEGSGDRALGRWYFRVPAWLGGSKSKSEAHLRRSLTYNPHSTISRYFLAETLFGMNRDREAIAELRLVLAARANAEYEPEDREYKAKAARLLAERAASVGP